MAEFNEKGVVVKHKFRLSWSEDHFEYEGSAYVYKMTSPFSLPALVNAVWVRADDVQTIQPPNPNVATSSSTSILSSSADGAISAQVTPQHQQPERPTNLGSKPKSGNKGPSKCPPPTSTPPSKRPKVVPASANWGKSSRSSGMPRLPTRIKVTSSKPKTCGLMVSSWIKERKLNYCQKLVVAIREEQDRLKLEKDTLVAQVESLSLAGEEMERLWKALSEADEKAKAGEKVPELKQRIQFKQESAL